MFKMTEHACIIQIGIISASEIEKAKEYTDELHNISMT